MGEGRNFKSDLGCFFGGGFGVEEGGMDLGFIPKMPTHALGRRCQAVVVFGSNRPGGTDHCLGREVPLTGEHGGDSRRLNSHSLGELHPGDTLFFHAGQQGIDEFEVFEFRLTLKGEGGGEEVRERIRPVGHFNFHGKEGSVEFL